MAESACLRTSTRFSVLLDARRVTDEIFRDTHGCPFLKGALDMAGGCGEVDHGFDCPEICSQMSIVQTRQKTPHRVRPIIQCKAQGAAKPLHLFCSDFVDSVRRETGVKDVCHLGLIPQASCKRQSILLALTDNVPKFVSTSLDKFISPRDASGRAKIFCHTYHIKFLIVNVDLNQYVMIWQSGASKYRLVAEVIESQG